MESGDLLSIYPTELKFPFELKKHSSGTLQLKNKTNSYVAFKMQTTIPAKYRTRPCMGVVLPGKTCDVTVTMRAEKEFPHDMQCKDKFLVQSVVASTGATAEDITPEMFNKKSGKVEEFKLRAIYVLANLAGSSSWATIDDSGVSSEDLFSFHPTELNFPLELNKQTSCHVLQLTNKTKHYITFKQRTLRNIARVHVRVLFCLGKHAMLQLQCEPKRNFHLTCNVKTSSLFRVLLPVLGQPQRTLPQKCSIKNLGKLLRSTN